MPPASEKIAHQRPAQIVAGRIREARRSRDWTQDELAKRLKEVGYPMTRDTVVKIEGGRIRDVKVNDLFAFAAALGISPVYLMTPLEDDATVAVTEEVRLPARVVRDWIAGDLLWLPMFPDLDLEQVPESKLAELIAEHLARDVPQPTRRLMRWKFEEQGRELAKQIRNPKEEDNG